MFSFELSSQTHLRLIEARFAEDFFRLVEKNKPRLEEWCPWLERVSSVRATKDFIREKLFRFAAGDGFTAGIFHDGRLSGVIALEYIDSANAGTEIGYWLDEAIEGNGVVTQACRKLIDHVFTDLELRRIQIRCAVENYRSRAIPERLGFRQEGTLRASERQK
jgi:ribosomal-protein-serine acetyltransferase